MRWTDLIVQYTLLFGYSYCFVLCMTQCDLVSEQLVTVWYCTIVLVFYCLVLAYYSLLWYCPSVSGVHNVAQILVWLSKQSLVNTTCVLYSTQVTSYPFLPSTSCCGGSFIFIAFDLVVKSL